MFREASGGEVVVAGDSDSDASEDAEVPGDRTDPVVFEMGDPTTAEDFDMTDETSARLLAIQEELGLDDDEIMLLAGSAFGGTSSSRNKASYIRKENIKFKSARTAKTGGRGPIPSAKLRRPCNNVTTTSVSRIA